MENKDKFIPLPTFVTKLDQSICDVLLKTHTGYDITSKIGITYTALKSNPQNFGENDQTDPHFLVLHYI